MVEAIWVILAVLLAALAAALGVALSARMRDVRRAQAKLAAVEERLQEAERQLQGRHDEESLEASGAEAYARLEREREEARAESARLTASLSQAESERDAARQRAETLERSAAAAARERAPRPSEAGSSESERLAAALARAENDVELSAERAQRFEEDASRLREEVARLQAELARVGAEADERVRRQQQVAEQRLGEIQKRQGPAAAAAARDLPAVPDAPGATEPTPEAKRTGSRVAATPARGKTESKTPILLAESESRARKALAKHLEVADYSVSYASQADEVLSLFRSEAPPAALVLDIETAGLDGWGLLQELKADAATRDIPVLVVAPARDRERALDLGAAQAFSRPLDSAVLLGAIRSAMLARKNRERRMVAAARVSAMTSSPGVPLEEVIASAAALARERKTPPPSTPAAAAEAVSAAP